MADEQSIPEETTKVGGKKGADVPLPSDEADELPASPDSKPKRKLTPMDALNAAGDIFAPVTTGILRGAAAVGSAALNARGAEVTVEEDQPAPEETTKVGGKKGAPVPPPLEDPEPIQQPYESTGEGEEPAPAAQSKKLGAKSAVGNMMNGGNMMGGLLGVLLGALIGGPIGALIGLLLGFGAMAAFGGALGGGSDDKQTETVARGENVQVKSDDRTPKMQLNIDLGDNKGLLVKGQADENGNFVVTDSIRTEDNKPVKGSEKHFVPAKIVPMDASGAVNVDDVVKKVEEAEKPSTPKRGDKIATRTVSDNSPAPAPKEIKNVKALDAGEVNGLYQVKVEIDGKDYTLTGGEKNKSADGKSVTLDTVIGTGRGGSPLPKPMKSGITVNIEDIEAKNLDGLTKDIGSDENKKKLAEPISKMSDKGPVASAPEKDGAHVDTGSEVSPTASGRGAAPKAAATGRK